VTPNGNLYFLGGELGEIFPLDYVFDKSSYNYAVWRAYTYAGVTQDSLLPIAEQYTKATSGLLGIYRFDLITGEVHAIENTFSGARWPQWLTSLECSPDLKQLYTGLCAGIVDTFTLDFTRYGQHYKCCFQGI
jgi:hypothetical protein